MKDAIISIKGIQDTGDEYTVGGDTIELVTSGLYSHSDDETVFSYQESEITGMDGTKTTFSIRPEIITLTREGSINSQMVFQEGKKHIFAYVTEYGTTAMGVSTHRILEGMGNNGGKVEIDYTIDMDSTVVSQNTFVIDVRMLEGKGGAVPKH